MEAPSATSKVTVTYWDPAALFPLIEPDLRNRLPLRNLHWKSATRPLRSINSLHVDLSPYSPPPSLAPADNGAPQSQDLSRVRSTDSNRSIDFGRPGSRKSRSRPPTARKERRHQIPGLRKTPYLKVYILRCDDNDQYKNTQRSLLRDWISTHTPQTGDNHDAFQWLIIHVVLPGTPAAQQPRASSSASNASGGPRWMKGGTSTLLDKIRSDFNGSSAKVDRIMQIRIPQTHPDLNTLSPPVIVANQINATESETEREMSWLDLIAKFKTQILSSFDARVTQYEEDIKEKDSQRHLPGWNFCTFFVLKEGLARAFESVGLVEDALVLYDELGFGLDDIVKQEENAKDEIGRKFMAVTKENLRWIDDSRKRLKERKEGKELPEDEVEDDNPIHGEKKPYRELILSNEISVFDFKCYLFSRQQTLLLRLGRRSGEIQNRSGTAGATAGAGSVTQEFNNNATDDGDDLLRLAEVCKRGVEFIAEVSRVLRADLWTAYRGSIEDDSQSTAEKEEIVAIIDNLLSSWNFAVCQQLLVQTTSPALPEVVESNSNAQRSLVPKRSSSLPTVQHGAGFVQAMRGAPVAGLEELAAGRADLMVFARCVVEELGRRKRWTGKEGWFFTPEAGSESEGMEEIDLNGDAASKAEGESALIWVPEGIKNKRLRDTLSAEEKKSFLQLFMEFSEKAMKLYGVAKRYRSAERVEADLAALKFHSGDYDSAAIHLQRITKHFGDQNWGLIETTLLGMYAKCLKHMSKPTDYVRTILRLLAKSASMEKMRILKRAGRDVDAIVSGSPAVKTNTTQDVDIRGYVHEVETLSDSLENEVTAPMEDYWTDIVVEPYPQHLPGKDGFEVAVKMRYLLDDELATTNVSVRLVGTSDSNKDLWLETSPGPTMRKGIVRTTVSTNSTIPGTYVVERVVVRTNKVVFQHDLMPPETPDLQAGLTTKSARPSKKAVKKTQLFFYPSPRNLVVRLEVPRRVHLDHMRAVELVIDAGQNDITSGAWRIKPATAGVRLIMANMDVLEGASSIEALEEDKPGLVKISSLSQQQCIRLRIPYTSESDVTDLSLRVDVEYHTANGSFEFADQLAVMIALPLAVNVQDVFKINKLFSKFQVLTSPSERPLRILKTELQGSKTFAAEAACGTEGSILVYAKQPASFVYKITRKTPEGEVPAKEQEPLSLVLEYTSLDEEVRRSVAAVFKAALKKEGLERVQHALLPHITGQLAERSSSALETITLADEIPLDDFASYGWDSALDAIPSSERSQVESFLKAFFANNCYVALSKAEGITRTIIIPVDVPQLQVIHSVNLSLLCDPHSQSLQGPYAPPMVTVGQGLAAELVVRHSRAWDTAAAAADISRPLEFVFEIHNNADIWLVSGRKRAHFMATDGGVYKFPLLLVPLVPGHLLLPAVEVKQVMGEGEVLSCETDYRAAGVSVLVLRDVRSTTTTIVNGPYEGEEQRFSGGASSLKGFGAILGGRG